MSDEKTYLKGDNFEVTSSKVVVGSTTYALRNIAGTSIKQQIQGGKVGGWICIALGVLPFLGGINMFTLVWGIIMIAVGLYMIKFLLDKWFVVISSGGK